MEPREVFLAREAYAAYGLSTDNKNYQGKEMPKWAELPPAIQQAWIAAVTRVSELERAS